LKNTSEPPGSCWLLARGSLRLRTRSHGGELRRVA
jgi:hypothetical protein